MWWRKVYTFGSSINRNILSNNNKCIGNVKGCAGFISFQHHSRNYSRAENENDSVDYLSRFERMLRERRRQVKKTVLIHIFNKFVVGKLFNYCQKYGNISRVSHYKLNNDKEFILLEFETEKEAEQLLSNAIHFRNENVIPVYSKCLWFQNVPQAMETILPVGLLHYTNVPKDQVIQTLREADSVSDQMIKLHESLKLSEVGQLLRFFVCHQLEMALSGLFSNCTILPFGSTVNGFGKFHCDLDMVLSLKDEISASSNLNLRSDDSRMLYFHTKRSVSNDRIQSQRNLEIMADMIGCFLPGCSSVQRILHARVPIIKFRHDLIDTECDLSMSNLSGVYMSELLYLLGEFDNRLNLLGFSVLYWAKEVGMTHDQPGKWITNFSLILMTVFFLQTRPNPILPSLAQLQQLAGNEDMRVTDGIDCSFLRQISKFPKMENQESLDELLVEFFKFYSNFDYRRDGISIVEGKKVAKADYSAFYIENPLELHLNVSKNVSREELERIGERMQKGLCSLDCSTNKRENNWGLLSLFNVRETVEDAGPLLQRITYKELFEKRDGSEETAEPKLEIPKLEVNRNKTAKNGAAKSPNGKTSKSINEDDLVSKLKLKAMFKETTKTNNRIKETTTTNNRTKKTRKNRKSSNLNPTWSF